jgi:hypothetical protein
MYAQTILIERRKETEQMKVVGVLKTGNVPLSKRKYGSKTCLYKQISSGSYWASETRS